MDLLFVPKLKESRTVSELIISILSEDFPLSIKALHFRLAKIYGKEVSYQAVFKALKILYSLEVIKKEGKLYFLNEEWISYLKNFSLQLEKRYKLLTKEDLVAEYLFSSLV